MYSQYSNYYQKPELKDFISNTIKNKNNTIKQHSDCMNCLINCAEYKFILQVIQGIKKEKTNIFFIQEKENLSSPLFFYGIPSNEIIDLIENKNISEDFLNASQKIKNENDIINNYEQNKKNKILLFSYIQFPLININSENNFNKQSTIIILDDGKHDATSNFSKNSYSNVSNNYSLLFDIHNLKSANYLFSINDIKDSIEIKIKFNGNIHGQQLLKKDAICSFYPDLIINSIKKRMKKYNYLKEEQIKNNLYGKYFFTKIYDKNRNNFGILFSFNKNKDINKIKFDSESILNENYIINKIFFCVDMWVNKNNIRETNDTSKTSSKSSNIKIEYNYNIAQKNLYTNSINTNDIFYSNNNINNNYNNFYNYDYKIYNNYNNKLDNDYYNNNYINTNNYSFSTPKNYEYNNKYEDIYNNSLYYRNNKYNNLDLDSVFKTDYENMEYLENSSIKEYYELNILLNNIDLLKNNNENSRSSKSSISSKSSKTIKDDKIILFKNENIYRNKSIFLDINNELIEEVFSKYKEDECISNYTILKKRLDINMNIEKEKLKKIKLKYFFDCFKDINNLSLNFPYLNEKGKLLFTEISPTLSSMRLILKTKKSIIKKLKKERKDKFKINKIKENIVKIEFEENKPPQERDLLYNQINKIKNIIGENKLSFNNILFDKSYFCILWSFTNTKIIYSSFLAYYSFDFKLIGIFIINLNIPQWFSSFSYDIDIFKYFKQEYNENIEKIKVVLKNLSIDEEDGCYQNFFTHDYFHYIKSCNN